jgi:chorismate mutase
VLRGSAEANNCTPTPDPTHQRSTTMTGPVLSTPQTDTDSHIGELRQRLDEIDVRIIELWQERSAISQQVGATRVAAGGTRLSLAREQEILNRYRDGLGEDGIQLAILVLRAGRGRLV